MNRLTIGFVAAAFGAAFFMPAAQAQMVCGDRSEIVKALEGTHEEVKTGAGISGNGGLVELFTGESGSWTLLLTMPDGPTCLLGSGEGWVPWGSDKPSEET